MPLYFFVEQASGHPSAADLDSIHADIKYPRKESYYLDYYLHATVTQKCRAVINPNADDVMAERNHYDVYKGERATILAQSGDYACVIFPDLGRAGWINAGYLSYD